MIRVAVPWPVPALWPNRRKHWREKSDAAKTYKQAAYYLAANARKGVALPASGPIQCSIVFYPPDGYRKRDFDNMLAAIKYALDGIAQACGVDDSRFRPGLNVGDPVTHGLVEITLKWEVEQHEPGDGV